MLKSENEIVSVFRNYIRTQQVSEEIDASYESTLDGLLVSHEKISD